MKLKSFRILNYKSIIDSGECRISENDNITVLAGQNESGKSSVLQALRDFSNRRIDPNSIRDDDSHPEICCTFTDIKESLKDDSFLNSLQVIDPVKKNTSKFRRIKANYIFQRRK